MSAITVNSTPELVEKLLNRGFFDDDPSWFFLCYQRILDGKAFTLRYESNSTIEFLIQNEIPYKKSVRRYND